MPKTYRSEICRGINEYRRHEINKWIDENNERNDEINDENNGRNDNDVYDGLNENDGTYGDKNDETLGDIDETLDDREWCMAKWCVWAMRWVDKEGCVYMMGWW